MSIGIIQGDARVELPKLPADFFDCICTSPPYYGLRDYGCDGQIGLEPTLDEYLETMVSVCRELRRVLKPSGDGSPYTVATGSKAWLANFLISLIQFGDGAAGAGGLTGANEMALKLASGTAVYADIQILSQATPNASQTFTIIPELLN